MSNACRKRRKSFEDTLLEKALNASHEALGAFKGRGKPDGSSKFAEVVADKLRRLGDILDVELQILQALNNAIKKKNEQTDEVFGM